MTQPSIHRDAGANGPLAAFEPERRRLFGVAYRMLGSVHEAEDALQDAWLRWQGVDHAAVENPSAFLLRLVTRICIDILKAARTRRLEYVGPWLPEPLLEVPVSDASHDPEGLNELADDLLTAFLLMLERLAEGGSARPADPASHDELLGRFLTAARSGDWDGLLELLSSEVVAYADGGGRVTAARKPDRGAGPRRAPHRRPGRQTRRRRGGAPARPGQRTHRDPRAGARPAPLRHDLPGGGGQDRPRLLGPQSRQAPPDRLRRARHAATGSLVLPPDHHRQDRSGRRDDEEDRATCRRRARRAGGCGRPGTRRGLRDQRAALPPAVRHHADRADLGGRVFIDQPPVFRLVAPNLTRGREGRRPDGGTIDPRYMPIGMTSHLTDEEILAIWRYRRTLPPKTVGGR